MSGCHSNMSTSLSFQLLNKVTVHLCFVLPISAILITWTLMQMELFR